MSNPALQIDPCACLDGPCADSSRCLRAAVVQSWQRMGLVISAVPTVVGPGPGPHLLGLPLTALPWWEGAVADLPGVGLGSRGKNKLPTPLRPLA